LITTNRRKKKLAEKEAEKKVKELIKKIENSFVQSKMVTAKQIL
jgi:hypothetical protein